MRQLYVQAPPGSAQRVMELAQAVGANGTARVEAGDEDGDISDLVLVDIPNNMVDTFLESLEELADFRSMLLPQGVLSFRHPAAGPALPVTDASPRSPMEILLTRRIEATSPLVFLGYAAVTGIIVWIGLFEEVVYLLTGAMLVAPFAGPALNAGVATATGDVALLRRSWFRYLLGVGITILVAGLLSAVAGMRLPTNLAVEVTSLSTFVLLLPLAAGLAGSLFVVNADESSTVSGAAVSMLVAAAIAPPAGVAGMAIAVGDWPLAGHAMFQVGAQVLGINLVSAVVLRTYGMTPSRPAFVNGASAVFPVVVATTAIALAGLLALQIATPGVLQQVDKRLAVADAVATALADDTTVELVDTDVRTAVDESGRTRLVVVARIVPREGVSAADAMEHARRVLTEELDVAARDVDLIVDVNLVGRVEPSG